MCACRTWWQRWGASSRAWTADKATLQPTTQALVQAQELVVGVVAGEEVAAMARVDLGGPQVALGLVLILGQEGLVLVIPQAGLTAAHMGPTATRALLVLLAEAAPRGLQQQQQQQLAAQQALEGSSRRWVCAPGVVAC
jgi:hypothetical protein